MPAKCKYSLKKNYQIIPLFMAILQSGLGSVDILRETSPPVTPERALNNYLRPVCNGHKCRVGIITMEPPCNRDSVLKR